MKSYDNIRWKLKRISDKLQDYYPLSNLENKPDPTDEAFFILLTTQTNYPKYSSSWRLIKKQFPNWDLILKKDIELKLNKLLQPAGLASQKSRLIIKMAQKIALDQGTVDLSFLHHKTIEEIEQYLVNLPGLGIKSARCILMYSLNKEVFPLDTHCYRIMRRLGVIPNNMPYQCKKTHDYAQASIHAKDRYRLHVLMIQHGRAICRSKNPKCIECSIRLSCLYKGENISIK